MTNNIYCTPVSPIPVRQQRGNRPIMETPNSLVLLRAIVTTICGSLKLGHSSHFGYILMKMNMILRLVVIFFYLLFSITRVDAISSSEPTIYFVDDPDLSILKLGNDYYEIGIYKANGGIKYIQDKVSEHNVSDAEQYVSDGSRGQCLWGGVFLSDDYDNYVGGCKYQLNGPNREFSWQWNELDQRLNLHYVTIKTDKDDAINVWVDITPSVEHWFDMKLSLENSTDRIVDRVLFPSDLMFLKEDMQEILLPVMPGVVLKPSVFDLQPSYSYVIRYPGWPGVFSDYQAVKSSKGNLAMYTIHKESEIINTWLGPIEDNDLLGSYYLYHTFYPRIQSGVTWDSPTVRIHIGTNFIGTIEGYRMGNHFDSQPDLRLKLGSDFEQVASSPIIKMDADRTISQYDETDTLSDISAPAILHWVSFWPDGFDENYPDLLPPKNTIGTTSELAGLFTVAREKGFFNMPYTNPTWWDDESPTMDTLSANSIAVLDENGAPKYECYPGTPEHPECTPENAARDSNFNSSLEPWRWLHGGYVVSPYATEVQQRLDSLMQEMTIELPSDFVFEDQVGARGIEVDFNNSAPNSMAYLWGWLEHTRTFADNRLMTETGYD